MNRWKTVYKRMGLVFLAASAVSLLVFIADNNRAPRKNKDGKSILERGSYGEGKRKIELEAVLGSEKEPLTVVVNERQYHEDKLPKVFDEAGKRLEKLVLGENKSLDEVRHNLKLVEKIPDTGVSVSWELGSYEVMNLMGELKSDKLQEEGTLVELKALLSADGHEAVHIFYAKVFPPLLNAGQKSVQALERQIQKKDANSKKDPYLMLPDSLNGKKVTWKYPGDTRAFGLFGLGIVAAGAIWGLEKQKKKQLREDRCRQLTADYPQLISRFTLFLGAGMTVRRAWFKMASDYERQKKEKGARAAFEEMVYAMHEIQGGISENESYERFGSRCGVACYRRFGAVLSQNLRKGSRGLTDLLKKEAADAFEERKNSARKLGEEAGTKLLGPMFMMLAVVLIIIVVPAFLSIQI